VIRIQKSETRILKPDLSRRTPDLIRGKAEVRKILVSVLLLSCLFFSIITAATPAFASCFNPAGNAGDTISNGGYGVYQYCNGGAWIGIGHVSNLTGGLAGWWKLDDGAGTSAADSSGNGNTGNTNHGSPPATWTPGINNGALKFVAANSDFVQVADAASLDLSGSFTLSAWVNFSSLPTSGNDAEIITKHLPTGWDNYKIFLSNTAGVYAWKLEFTDITHASYNVSYTNTPSTGTWYHVTGTWDGTTLTLYVNGIPLATSTPGAVPNGASGAPLYLGTSSGGGNLLDGTIDDVRVYSRALSAADIRTLYTSTGGESGDINTGLTGYWKLDDASGATAADSTGNGNTGTLTNGPTWAAGKVNGALTFNGTTQYVLVPNSSSIDVTGTNLTMAAWIQITGATGKSYQNIFGKDSVFGAFQYRLLISDSRSSLRFQANGGAIDAISNNFTALTLGTWHHVAVAYNGSSINFYLDGQSQGSTPATGSIASSSNDLDIGKTYALNYYFDGTIDDVRVYNRALSASDVLTLYNSTLTACAGPVGYAGDEIYNNGTNHVLQYCNGSSWVKMGPVPGAGTGPGCSSPAGSEGDTIYNKDYYALQYCDGTNWVVMGTKTLTGLVGWWNLDEGSGTSAADSSGNGNTGTLGGSPLPTWTTSGKFNGALNLANLNDTVNIPSSASLQFSGAFSASIWLNTTGLSSAGEMDFIGNEDYPNTGWLLLDNGPYAAKIEFRIDPGLGYASFARSLVNDGTWHNLVGVYDGTNVKLYLDGALKDTQPAGVFTNNALVNNVGWNSTGNSMLLDDARIYNRALGAGEIAHLYNGGP